MDKFDLYKNIGKEFVTYSAINAERFKVAEAKEQITDIINGKRINNKRFVYVKFNYAKDYDSMTDAELLMEVLKNCDEETLLGLENEFGKKSRLSELIRECFLSSKPDEHEETINSLKNILEESEKKGNKLYSMIFTYIMDKGFETDADFYNSISMSRQNFSRIRNNPDNVGKECILWIICGLGLNYIQAKNLLKMAGYAFKNNDKRDIVISYIIKNVKDYNIDMINETLYHFGLKCFFDN